MNKKFRKFISIFVITVFVLASIPTISFAAQYGNSALGATAVKAIYSGSNIPSVTMVNPEGTQWVQNTTTPTTAELTQAVILEWTGGVYGKENTDATYKTYDYPTRSTLTYDSIGTFRIRNYMGATNDLLLEFSFLYETPGTPMYATSPEPILRVFSKLTDKSDSISDNKVSFLVSPEGFVFDINGISDETALTNKSLTPYKFEENKWYSVSLLYDIENGTATTGNYTHKAYINGELVATSPSTTSYTASDLYLITPIDSVLYWDNVSFSSTNSETYICANRAANLISTTTGISVTNEKIELSDMDLTIKEVKDAIADSVNTDEVVRIYNSDYSAELTDEESQSALGTKLIVSQTRSFIKSQGSTATVDYENTYTYYDVVAGKAAFDEPVVTADASTGKASGTVNMHNYTGEAQSFKGYLAVYNGTELAALGVADFEAEAEDTEVKFSINDVPYSSGYTTKFFVWKADGITPELASK